MHEVLSIPKLFFIAAACLLIVACSSTPQNKQLDYKKITPAGTQKTMLYSVYTPPNWQVSEQLPLIVFLHGAGSNHKSFESFGANNYFDEQIIQGKMPRVILLSPNGDLGFWENWTDGTHNYRDWVLNDILPSVQKNYNTLSCPEHCHVMGISMGGFGALRFSYLSKNVFSSVSAISAPIIGEEEKRETNQSLLMQLVFPFDRIFGEEFSSNYTVNTIENAFLNKRGDSFKTLKGMRLQLIVGDNDLKQMIKNNLRFHESLVAQNRDHKYLVFRGRHRWRDWIPTFTQSINFLVDATYKIKPQK
jgi:enterochelin esterase-like enzyme